MANKEHLAVLRQGVGVWNNWREENRDIVPDLRGADLSRANLSEANLSRADLNRANLSEAGLVKADLSQTHPSQADLSHAFFLQADLSEASLYGADLTEANLVQANLSEAYLSAAILLVADLSRADLRGAVLLEADLRGAKLVEADLSGADLQGARLIGTDLTGADLTGCKVYGISTWDLKLTGAKQRELVITAADRNGPWLPVYPIDADQPEITIDNLEVAQFIHLLLNNERIRSVIGTITSKLVLIFGRFTAERKTVLGAIRDELRKRDYLPVLFDFDKPVSRDITETVSLLARMARFVVADITEARSIPQELMVIAPDLPSVPIQPLLQEGSKEYGMFEHFKRYPWVPEEHVYAPPEQLIADLYERVIGPAEARTRDLQR